MSGINGVGNNAGIQRVVAPTVTRQPAAPDAPVRPGSLDRLELSGISHLLKSLKNNDVRTDKVASVRAAIDAGTYEDDHKLDTAIDRLLDELER